MKKIIPLFALIVLIIYSASGQHLHEKLDGKWVNGPDGFEISNGVIRKIYFSDSGWSDSSFNTYYRFLENPKTSSTQTEEILLLSEVHITMECFFCSFDPYEYRMRFCKIEMLPDDVIRLSLTDIEAFSANKAQSTKRLLKEAESLNLSERPYTFRILLRNIKSLKPMPLIQL